MSKKRIVKNYPHWRQIGFKNCTKDRNELKITEHLLSLEVIKTVYTSGGWLRLYVDANYES